MVQTILNGLDCPNAEISIVITDDTEIHELNRTWRGKDRPTDVLSFPQAAAHATIDPDSLPELPDGVPVAVLQGAPHGAQLLGDVVISADTAARQAAEIGHSVDDEFCRLLVHGILHLLGHDHVHGGEQEARMQAEEARLLALLASELGAST